MGFDAGMQLEGVLEEFQPMWMREQAACKELPWTMFFSDSGTRREHFLPGIAVCWTCPVRERCLEYALQTNTKAGVFGGYTSSQRKRLKRDLEQLAS